MRLMGLTEFGVMLMLKVYILGTLVIRLMLLMRI